MIYKIILYCIKILDHVFDYIVYCIMLLCLLYGIYGLSDTYTIYNPNNSELLEYKPLLKDDNSSFNNIQNEYNDICSWLYIDNTNIDYPVLQYSDNSYYLNRDYKGDYALIGSVFLDYRNHKDFSDFYNLLYAHSMKGDCMFGMLPSYLKEDFFYSHTNGTIFINNTMHKLTLLASLYSDAYDTNIYYPDKVTSDIQKLTLLNYIKDNAKYYNPIDLSIEDNIIALSTCSYDSTNGRIIVFFKIENLY